MAKKQVESVTIAALGPDWKIIPGTEKTYEVGYGAHCRGPV